MRGYFSIIHKIVVVYNKWTENPDDSRIKEREGSFELRRAGSIVLENSISEADSMKKAGRLTVFILMFALILNLAGCGEFLKSVNSLEIDSGGNVKAFSISAFDKGYYSGTELRKQILDSVSEYNESAKDERISLNSCKVSKKKARVILKYKSIEDYASFNHVLAWSGTLTSAMENGYFDRDTTVMSSDGTLKTTIGELEGSSGRKTDSLKVLIVEEPLMIKVPGKIRYTIGDVTMEGGYAITGAGSLTFLLNEPCYIIYK